jgi:acetate kinase
VLVLNSGSSSVKYGLFRAGGQALEEVCSGLVDKIGLDGTVIKHEFEGQTQKISGPLADHGAALKKVAEILTASGGPVKNKSDIKVVGHRVVHGGAKFAEPAIIDDVVEAEIERCVPLAPLHNPPNLLGIRMAKQLFPVVQVAVFDTAFHATMPPESYRYAIPKDLYEKHNVRRYGFHGTSYKYVSGAVAQAMGRNLQKLNMIICHLGNGCSMACLKDGKVVDTTMGLTPLEGLMMGTRSGDLDVGICTYLNNQLGMTPPQIDTLLNKKSGLLGVSGGKSSDMRDIIGAAKDGDADCALARSLYVQRVRKYLGAFLVKLNGKLDALVFTAGVGENDREFRELVTADLDSLGIDVDPQKNRDLKGGGEIQSRRSRSKVLVVNTQEELSLACQSLELCGLLAPGTGLGDAPFKVRSDEIGCWASLHNWLARMVPCA